MTAHLECAGTWRGGGGEDRAADAAFAGSQKIQAQPARNVDFQYVPRFHPCIKKSLPRSSSLPRVARRHRVLGRARDGANGPLPRLRTHGDNHDRPRLDRSLDRFEGREMLRGPHTSQHVDANSPAGDRRCSRCHSGNDWIFCLDVAGWSHDTGVRRRIRCCQRRIVTLERRGRHGPKPDRSRNSGNRPLLLRSAWSIWTGRNRGNPR